MIRTDSEYNKALERLEQDAEYIQRQRKHFEELGLTREEQARAMQPALSFHEQLKEEVEAYERMKRGDLGTLHSLSSIGRWLIGVRIARGWSQKELAKRLAVSEAQVSRDERNEYHGVSTEKAQRILDVLSVQFRLEEDSPVGSPYERGTASEVHRESKQSRSVETSTSHGDVSLPATKSTPDQVAVFLRADRNLNPSAADKLAQMFRLAYEAVAISGKPESDEGRLK